MEINEKRVEDVITLGVNGRLDTTNYSILEQKLMSCYDSGNTRIIMDCGKLDYISSSGLRVLLMALKKASLLKGRFVMADLQDTIREIFEIAGFTTIFEIYKSVEEAEKAIGNRQ
jgi:anti-anti-sigma factor